MMELSRVTLSSAGLSCLNPKLGLEAGTTTGVVLVVVTSFEKCLRLC